MESSSKIISSLKRPELVQTQAYVNGNWVSSTSGDSFAVNNPALYPKSEAKIAEVTSMTLHDFNNAIEAAHRAFSTFQKTSGRYRAGLLHDLYQLMMENKDDLAKLVVLENGKPYADALGEVTYAASFFQWYSEEAPRVYGDIIPSSNSTNRILAIKQPIGVCGIMTPWNFPLAMITRKLGAAIAAGCTSVIKPASETPLSATALGYLSQLAKIPPGVVNILPAAESSSVGKLITEHPLVSKVSFTGSTAVGKILMKQSASTLKKLSMELGGNAPLIVFNDADIDKAVTGAIASKFRSSGQTCVCANRLFVHEDVYEEFSNKLVAKLEETTTLGNGFSPDVTHGPVIHDRSMKKVRQHIEDAVSKGAKVLYGGSTRPDLGENFHELTVLGNVTTDMLIAQEETFGPVAPLIKFSTDEEVIQLANDTRVGLAGYFYANDVTRIFKVAESLKVGMIGVNTGAISEASLPFGGVSESGFGREGSKYGIDDYLITKSVVLGGID
ncbi:uncharacterized protein SPAPADRAFT_58029 [Spathaspora passalidarum NRRL Y-27907]|uniref:Succinate-semialdehyde dehydrogenase n=1 Tax=Spathaspora passalidarum (strain NRRL Y-27907 / 11-Y1) TaxID=619300 RepID=G3AFB5_SPAPN|nr:uncharacterized protein SPAPADRAFT_58029 [Spathaspora passalidarum NRRL Y-27907]EGW34904.1 hypothetical protein SPAPADRAFT_58029 [Spathaspora passalidarum NRRL Y-27907]